MSPNMSKTPDGVVSRVSADRGLAASVRRAEVDERATQKLVHAAELTATKAKPASPSAGDTAEPPDWANAVKLGINNKLQYSVVESEDGVTYLDQARQLTGQCQTPFATEKNQTEMEHLLAAAKAFHNKNLTKTNTWKALKLAGAWCWNSMPY